MSERRETGRKPKKDKTSPKASQTQDWSKGERIAKWLASAGVCSRREAERMIEDGLVSVNGEVLKSAAFKVTGGEKITVEGRRVGGPEKTRLWKFHKPKGLVTTNSDPEGRPTVFEHLPKKLPRVMTIGRLDLNTEGLLLLTNDGELARTLELPTTGLKRCYRARAFGKITQAELDRLQEGVMFEGIVYRSIIATLDKTTGDNNWIDMILTEGKKREARRALESVGLIVNRLIRVSYGPFELGELPEGGVAEIPAGELLAEFGDSISRKRRPDPSSLPQSYEFVDNRRKPKGRNDSDEDKSAAKKATGKLKPLRGEKNSNKRVTKEPENRNFKRNSPHRYAALREGAEERDFSKPASPGEAKVPSSMAKKGRKPSANEMDSIWVRNADGTKKELPQRAKTAGSRRDRARAKGNKVHPTKEQVEAPVIKTERTERDDGGLPWRERSASKRKSSKPQGVKPARRGGSSSKTDRANKPRGRR
ncbi:pseudouridine synthase [Hirschia maritima]|uniref:pseudouridine synthase n=1 Tax=Hirschia maritima TaxID=1121961 RepID=UPI00035CB192|nr:pseudouridine synthase [Hirschia maritima]